MRPIDDIIARHEFFKDFRPDHLELLQSCAEEKRFNRDQYLLRQGQGAERFFLIRKGEVHLELVSPEGRRISMQVLGPGDIVGWSWMVPPYKWSFDAQAVETTIAIVFDGAALRKRCEKDFEFASRIQGKICEALTRRLVAACEQILELHEGRELEE